MGSAQISLELQEDPLYFNWNYQRGLLKIGICVSQISPPLLHKFVLRLLFYHTVDHIPQEDTPNVLGEEDEEERLIYTLRGNLLFIQQNNALA